MTDHNMRRFTAYRPYVAEKGTHNEDQMNQPWEVQYEGVVFTDGTCVLRWRTAVGSFSVWDSFEAAMRIHGHPEYGTQIIFHDDSIPLPWDDSETEEDTESTDIEDFLKEAEVYLNGMFPDAEISVHRVELGEGEDTDEKIEKLLNFLFDKPDTPTEPVPRLTLAEAWEIIKSEIDVNCGFDAEDLEDDHVRGYVYRVEEAVKFIEHWLGR